MLGELDQAIAERLTPVREYLAEETAVLVRKLPNKAGKFGKREEVDDEGDVYFVIRSGKCDPPTHLSSSGRPVQDEVLTITLVVDLPERHTKYGCYDVWERCKARLLGFHPPQIIKPIYLNQWNFIRDRFWVIEAEFIAVTKTTFNDGTSPEPTDATVAQIGHKDINTNEIIVEVKSEI